MQYFDEMRTKWGFEDGGTTPPDAIACREVYVKVINKCAKKAGSKFRAYAYDRGGCHNGIMILFASLENIKKNKVPLSRLSDGDFNDDKLEDTDKYDEAMDTALQDAMDLDIDQYVVSKVTIDRKGLKKILE
jgi:hypothetical protein